MHPHRQRRFGSRRFDSSLGERSLRFLDAEHDMNKNIPQKAKKKNTTE
jgi:hypothetical protein